MADHNRNIQRIIDRLKADPAVYDGAKTEGKARKILFGDRPNDDKLAESGKPYIYVTTRDFLQTTKRDYGVDSSYAINQNSAEYEVVIVADSRHKTEKSQRQLYDILKNVRKNLESDPEFGDPENPGTDEIFSRSVISEVNWDAATRGKLATSVSLILLASLGGLYQLQFPGIGLSVNLRNESRNKGRNSARIANDEGDTKVSKGEHVGTMFYQYDYEQSAYDQIQTLIDDGSEILANIVDGSITAPITVVPVFQEVARPDIDQVKTVMLTMEEATA